MRWPWSPRPQPRHAAWSPPARIPDGDIVVVRGQRRRADVLAEVLREPTVPLPVVTPRRLAPLMTPAARWRTRRSAW
jgi:hypothetical protein